LCFLDNEKEVVEMKIPDKVKRLFNKEPVVAFATADRKGNPNVVPIYWKIILNDETILLLDKFMKQTKQNIQENRKVCVSFWNPDPEEAYKIKGTATYYSEGPIYEKGKKFMQSKKPGQAPEGIVEIRIEEIYAIKSGPDAGRKL
jgi:predicted pyridoxine 5'-phosphate oxidase superfamily flavin-nucleotide-binding protein